MKPASMKPAQIGWWQWRFRRYRVEYLQYLAALLAQNPEQQTLKVIFAKEVQRYGPKHPRGRLAQLWLQRLSAHGGDLAAAWQGCFPTDVLHIVRIGQQYGARSLTQALGHLAGFLQQHRQLKQQLMGLLWPALFALCVVGVTGFLLPLLTVPELKKTFALVPAEYYGIYTQRLFGFAQWLSQYGWFVISLPLAGIVSLLLSLRRWVGWGRHLADRFEPWSSYRLFHALNLLALAHILLELPGMRLTLKEIIQALLVTPNPWLKKHLQKIDQRIQLGHIGASSFDTGLLHQEELWFFSDMAEGQSLSQACQLTATRLRKQLVQRLIKRATILRWAILLIGVLLLVGVLFWHYRAFEELRQALLNVFA